MIRLKTLLMIVMTSAFAVALPSCSSSNEDELEGGSEGAIKLNRLDLSGAKYLTLGESTGIRSRANSDNVLFKVDENGNVSAVVLECIEGEDGTSTTVRKDISIHPREVRNLTSTWLYLFDCEFSSDDNRAVQKLLQSYDSYGSLFFNILVNKKTGKLFFIPYAYDDYFAVFGNYRISYPAFIDGPNGELYTQTHPTQGLSKVTVSSSGDAKIEKVGPADMKFGGGDLMVVLDNGTIALIPYNEDGRESLTVLYPNNGFETVADKNHDAKDYDKETFFNFSDGKIKAITLITEYPEEKKAKQTLQVRDVIVGTSFGSCDFSSPIIEVKQELTKEWGEHGYGYQGTFWTFHSAVPNLKTYYESGRYCFIGDLYAVDKSTGEVKDLSTIGTEVVFPNSENVYQGKAWCTYSDAADWFDCEALEGGRVRFDTSTLSNFIIKDSQPNISNGEFTITAISQVDGKKVAFVIDITNGKVKKTIEVNSTSESITLIPMN